MCKLKRKLTKLTKEPSIEPPIHELNLRSAADGGADIFVL
jgi:hypothetical protein